MVSAARGGVGGDGGCVPGVRRYTEGVRLVAGADGRGPGLSAVDLKVRDPAQIVARARARGLPATEDRVEVCGVRFHLTRA